MKFSEIISPTQIILDLKARDRWGAIEELIGYLVEQNQISESRRESVLEAVKSREMSMSTGIGFGIAMPHTATDAINHVVTILARSNSGINYESLDSQPVKLMLLFLVPQGQTQENLRAMALIARFLNNRDFRELAEHATTPEEIYEFILQREK
jgi:mannitol/fructose-specific phosphotransferase system IIA component (Ntr-type)